MIADWLVDWDGLFVFFGGSGFLEGNYLEMVGSWSHHNYNEHCLLED